VCGDRSQGGSASRSILERHHDSEYHAGDYECDEDKNHRGKRTALGPSAFGGAEDANALSALFGRVPCCEFGGRVEVDKEEGAEWPEQREEETPLEERLGNSVRLE